MGYSLFYKNTFDALLKGVFLCLLYKLVLSGRQLRKSEWFLVSLCPWPFQKGSNLIRLRDIDSIFATLQWMSDSCCHGNTASWYFGRHMKRGSTSYFPFYMKNTEGKKTSMCECSSGNNFNFSLQNVIILFFKIASLSVLKVNLKKKILLQTLHKRGNVC